MSAPQTRWAPIALWAFSLFQVWHGGAFDGTAWAPAPTQTAKLDQLFTGLACLLFVVLTFTLGRQVFQARRRTARVRRPKLSSG